MRTISDPSWPRGATGRRVLVECDDTAVEDGVVRALREQGYAVATCAGPRSRGTGTCPLVTEGACGLVEGADVIVHALDPAHPAHQEVAASIRRRVPEVPIVVEVVSGAHPGGRDGIRDCVPVRYPMTRAALLDAVDRSRRS